LNRVFYYWNFNISPTVVADTKVFALILEDIDSTKSFLDTSDRREEFVQLMEQTVFTQSEAYINAIIEVLGEESGLGFYVSERNNIDFERLN